MTNAKANKIEQESGLTGRHSGVTWILMFSICSQISGSGFGAEIVMRAELISNPPLPVQAIRVRVSFMLNGQDGNQTPSEWPDEDPFDFIRGGQFANYYAPSTAIVNKHYDSSVPPRSLMNKSVKLVLSSREVVSCSFATSAEWPAWVHSAKSLFDRPSSYELFWGESLNELKPYTCRFTVGEPPPLDKKVLQLVREDKYLADAMMSPINNPDPETGAKLREIVDRYPKSSYADYARFGLARTLVGGTGESLALERDDFTERINRFIKSFRDPSEMSVEDLSETLFLRSPLRGIRRAAIEGVIQAIRTDPAVLNNRISKVVDLMYPTDKDRELALSCLTSIDFARFAYAPNALILVIKLHADLNTPFGVENTTKLLERDWYDSIEWLDEVSESSKSAEEWRAYRIRKVTDSDNKEEKSNGCDGSATFDSRSDG